MTGASCNREYLNEVKRIGLITHNVNVQLDEPPFHLKILEVMFNYRSLAAKN